MARIIDGSPPPGNHVVTLSRVGYSFTAAIGDLIDNSIAAQATKIDIIFAVINGRALFVLADNGCGMSEEELAANMVIGCKDPDLTREKGDLGRFGSGLKTASFSQAKILTVLSWKKPDSRSAARWDTEKVRVSNSWNLELLDDLEINQLPLINDIPIENSGTVVIWDDMTCVDYSAGDSTVPHQITKLCKEAENFISLYFHRFISSRISLTLNGRRLSPLDPFMRDITGYQEGPSQELRSKKGKLVIQSHILPRIANLSYEQLDRYGGAKYITQHQGLFIYRDKRLILEGGWFGVSNPHELSNIVRIQIDIPVTMDDEWETDVRKSRLKIPPKVKQVLKRIVGSPIRKAHAVHKYRGKREEESAYWLIERNELEGQEQVSYRINPDNEQFEEFVEGLESNKRRQLVNYLMSLTSALPINHIYSTMASSPKSVKTENTDEEFDKFLEQISGS